ncbi:hypothetical protein PoB_003768400 [Plakobranchus ocellatus]|uniref:Sulfatase N-terminal domain-containing protein n=1 Tax=Plakobranchus ocellatus TaxID=259542 RepID=A0AAV4ATQ1_9GAST|nr:hypothetical protein PoB_003768400 [Plakobranchus ocellatus]
MQRHRLVNGGILLLIAFLGFTLSRYFWPNRCPQGTDLDTNHSYLTLKSKLSHLERNVFNTKQRPLSFLTERTCTFPNVDPFDPAIIDIAVGNKTALRCDLDFMPQLTYIDRRYLKVNTTQVDISLGTGNLSHCRYRNITGGPFDYSSVEFSDWSKTFRESVALEEDIEFIEVECFRREPYNVTISKSYFSLVPRLKHFEKLYNVRLKKRSIKYQPQETLNIVIVGLDGLSRHQFLRTMPGIYTYLTKTLNSFDFTMHGQLGAASFPNLLGLLSGSTLEEVSDWWDYAQPEDVFDLMFKHFENAGYRTLFSEDNTKDGAFYWENRTFLYPQASFWDRPVHLAMRADKGYIRRDGVCLGSRPISVFQLDYLLDFIHTFSDKPVFSLTWIDKVTHDDTPNAGMIEEHLFKFYQTLTATGYLNRTLVILFSDHGQRWGKLRLTPNGYLDSRNPFMMLTFPPWFLKKYPYLANNLRENTRVLTTHLDTHQMLLDILYFKSKEHPPFYKSRKGLNLFERLPDRTCKEAHIPSSQCLCNTQVEEELNTSSPFALRLSKTLFHAIKARADPKMCEEFHSFDIIHVKHVTLPDSSSSGQQSTMDQYLYRVTIIVYPGEAIFEGNFYYVSELRRYALDENIDRLNMYKVEKILCKPPREQEFCFCKGQL